MTTPFQKNAIQKLANCLQIKVIIPKSAADAAKTIERLVKQTDENMQEFGTLWGDNKYPRVAFDKKCRKELEEIIQQCKILEEEMYAAH